MQSLSDGYQALVIGASGAIGSAFISQLRLDPRCGRVWGIGRNSQPAIDFNDEATVLRAAAEMRAHGPLQLILLATGSLHGPHGMPEKRLAQLNYAQMEANFRVNTMGPALAMAHFAPLLDRHNRSILGVVSAKVGSIGDNGLGGWYSYRASKAALNMFLKTTAIEVARSHPLAVLAALHPGTVNSALSAPFRGAEIGRPPAQAAAELLSVLNGLEPEHTGAFWSYNGQPLPW